jgi:hypothetical protein
VHGLIFTSFRHYTVNRLGLEAADELWGGEPRYLLTVAYPDDRLAALVTRVAERAGLGPDDVLREFGVFAAESTFALLYPSAFAEAGSSRTFLLHVEERIHETLRAAVPSADPPRLSVTPLGAEAVRIAYESPRLLCPLLEGLVAGVARRYHERARLEKLACMREGDSACVYEVGFRPL